MCSLACNIYFKVEKKNCHKITYKELWQKTAYSFSNFKYKKNVQVIVIFKKIVSDSWRNVFLKFIVGILTDPKVFRPQCIKQKASNFDKHFSFRCISFSFCNLNKWSLFKINNFFFQKNVRCMDINLIQIKFRKISHY